MIAKIDTKLTRLVKELIKSKYRKNNYWIAQDKNGDIFCHNSKPELYKNLTAGKNSIIWMADFNNYQAFFICNSIKGKYITNCTHSLAQLGKDNFYLDTRGRLIVESSSLSNLLKEQA